VVATGSCERVWPAERRPILARAAHFADHWLAFSGRAVFPVPSAAVEATRLAGHPVPVEQEAAAAAVLQLGGQLIEPFLAAPQRRTAS
jgi:hypothetical protein